MAVFKDIQGKNVCLKAAAVEDALFTYSLRQDQKRTQYMHSVNGDVEDQEKWIKEQRKKEGDYFFVVYSTNRTPIGTVSVYDINHEGTEGEVGRAILNGNPMQNMEALVLIHEFAFLALGLKRLKTSILSDNTASIGVTLRMGGIENCRIYNDEFQSYLIWYDIWREEYLKRREQFIRLIERFGNR